MRRLVLLLLCVLLPSLASAQNSIRAKGTAALVGVSITQLTFPDGTEGVVYDGVTVTVTGGTGPYTCALFSGALPTSITETSECHYGVAQTPTVPGTYNFCLKATDSLAAVSPQQCYVVVIAATPGLPAGWFSSDIGPTVTPGSVVESSGAWTLTSSGSNITAEQDSFRYAWTTCTDTCVVTARITTLTGYPYAQAGVMIRASSVDNAALGFSFMLPVASGSLNQGKNRPTTGGTVTNESSGQSASEYVQVRRNGSDLSMWNSPDGVTYTQVGITHDTTLSSVIQAGIACTNIDTGSVATCAFDMVDVDDDEPTPDPSDDFGGYRNTWQGFGTHTTGCRGGSLIRVTKLTDTTNTGSPDYTGSLRAALLTAGARCIVFDTSGTIYLSTTIIVTDPFVTIAGQTAPDPGVTIAYYPVIFDTHDIVIQHMRFRYGDVSVPGNSVLDAIYLRANCYNVVFDHVSMSWGTHENLGVHSADLSAQVTNVSLLDSIFASPLTLNPASVSINALFYANANAQSMGTVMRSLFMHGSNRNPWLSAGWTVAHVNNVAYNPKGFAGDVGTYGYVQLIGQGYPSNRGLNTVSIGNKFIAGVNTFAGTHAYKMDLSASQVASGSTLYLSDNSGYAFNSTPALNQWDLYIACTIAMNCNGSSLASVGVEANTKIATLPSWYTALNITPIPNASVLTYVTTNAGARPLNRDTIDTALVLQPAAGTGQQIASQSQVGGWPTLAVNTATWADPSNPNDPGTCGTTSEGVIRTRRECALNASAVALEP